MKIPFYFIIAISLLSACNSGGAPERKIEKIVCDSVETPMYDENGEEYFVKVAGPCDTIWADEKN